MAKKKGKSVCHPLPHSMHLHPHGHCRDKTPMALLPWLYGEWGALEKKLSPIQGCILP